jgi:aminopeptidase N
MNRLAACLALAAITLPVAADPHSFAQADKFLVRHVALDLSADFEARRLAGTAELTVEQLDPGANALVLDTNALEIASVHLIEASGRAKVLAFKLGDPDPILGSRLTIKFPHCCAATAEMRIRIAYRTSSEAGALQWLEPAQTSGLQPFMYTQGQAILARSWMPIQDSPGIRMTYSARIRTPPGLVAVMSAAHIEHSAAMAGEFRFEMKQPIPAYLIALAIGDLKFRPLGNRVGVWAEPSRLDAAAHEFADLQRMLEAGEQIAGPYRWDRYDVLVMPRAFAYGGMENPRISFVSPSIIAGDRSLVSTVVHELAHSWSGNFVTNATWNDFWLNEGLTSYLEGRLVETLYGRRRADMEDAIAYQGLLQAIADLKPADTALKLDLAGRDPNEGTTEIAYDKGARFLRFLEGRFDRPAFDAFLRDYFDSHAFQGMTTEGFRGVLLARLQQPGAPRITAEEIDAWIYGPGLPPTLPAVPQGVFAAVDRAAADWRAGRLATADLPVEKWVPQEWVRFLDQQPADIAHGKLAELRSAFRLGADGNAEIALSWLQLVIRAGHEPAYRDLEKFLLATGRWRLVETLFRDLARTDSGTALGRQIYAKAKPGYHASIRQAVERLIYPAAEG